jgi:geranyl-CoA carboxylase alpha subunit
VEYRYVIEGGERAVVLEKADGGFKATLDGKTVELTATPAGGDCLILGVGGRTVAVRFARDDRGLHVAVEGHAILAAQPGAEAAGGGGPEAEIVDGKQTLVAPMPGQVVKINVKVGDAVKKKQCLAIVEAMKMEHELLTAIDGKVTAVHAEAGKQVGAMEALVEITQEK